VTEYTEAEVCIHGHTHQADVSLFKDKLFLNPGTISGATGGWSGRADASFIELIFSKNLIQVTLHKTDWSVVKTNTFHFRKENNVIIPER
jgi:predicted phosphodiesterase